MAKFNKWIAWIQSTWEQPMTSDHKSNWPISSPDSVQNFKLVIQLIIRTNKPEKSKHEKVRIMPRCLKKHVNMTFVIMKVNVEIYFEIWSQDILEASVLL